jgi:hypothetical protein
MHGIKGPGSVDNGDVQIIDATGNMVSMKEGADWLDGSDTYWYDSSVYRWGGRVQDNAHGQEVLALPLNDASEDPHKIIEPSAGNVDSYENNATLKIVDNVAYQWDGGTWADVTADMAAKGIISYTADKFTDKRENERVDCLEINLDKLYLEGYEPSNGAIYVSNSVDNYPAVRLNNGGTIDEPLTIISANPVYVNGDFNKVNKQPASILADAVTFLSNSWDDTKSNQAKSNRIASNTEVNVSIIAGHVATTAGDYSGGAENLPRLLESWTGQTFTWTGSMVSLWESTQATAAWSTSFYDEPNRSWSYDTDLDDPSNMPPLAPSLRVFQRTGWQQEYVGFQTFGGGIDEADAKNNGNNN